MTLRSQAQLSALQGSYSGLILKTDGSFTPDLMALVLSVQKAETGVHVAEYSAMSPVSAQLCLHHMLVLQTGRGPEQ